MLRHYVISAWRSILANRLQSAIAILGLSLGLAAAILAGLMIRNQLGYDSFLPGYSQLSVAGVDVELGGRAPDHFFYSPHGEAAKLALLPGVQAVARIGVDFDPHLFRRGAIQSAEFINDADPNIFDLLQLPVLYGDLKSALVRPDSIVIPLSTARKYFSTDNVLGQTLLLDGKHLLRVTAVVADLPVNGSNLRSAIFISSKAPWTDLAIAAAKPDGGVEDFSIDSETFVRLSQGVSNASVEARMQGMTDYLMPHPPTAKVHPRLIPLSALHTRPEYAPGVLDRLLAFTGVSLVILVLSVINFINLVTARAARRGVEVGIRKALGAARRDLMVQFLGEAVVQALFALLLAAAVVEWLAPIVNTALETGALPDYGRSFWLILALLTGTLLVGLAAGVYPALLLSSFRPALVLKGGPLGAERANLVRQGLVILQFCVLVVLGISAGVFVTQYRFALTRTFERAGQILFVEMPKCDGAFKDQMSGTAGVDAVACTDISFVKQVAAFASAKLPDGASTTLETVTAGPGLLEMFDQKPIAGRDLVAADYSADEPKPGDPPVHVVVNQAALRKLGISSPEAAIGHAMRWDSLPVPIVIVGVVRDFSTYALENPVAPTAYVYRDVPSLSPLVALKLAPGDTRAVLAAVNRNWSKSGSTGLFQSILLRDWIAQQRRPLLYEGAALAVFAGIAIVLGCLGLFGLSISTAERRIKEIGVRKAMGATASEITALLLWQFAKPVLWANLIAWPLAWWGLMRWLSGFAYHASLPLWLFPAAGTATLLVALITVAAQTVLVARQKPVLALRYE